MIVTTSYRLKPLNLTSSALALALLLFTLFIVGSTKAAALLLVLEGARVKLYSIKDDVNSVEARKTRYYSIEGTTNAGEAL